MSPQPTRPGLSAAERLMDMLLLLLATQMMMDGIAAYLGWPLGVLFGVL